MKTPRIYLALIALGGLHLLLVALGAAYVDLSDYGPVGRALNYYGEMSGANKSYGFFAPGVGSQARTRFEVLDAAGKSTEVSLERASSHEAELRINNITGQLTSDNDTSNDNDNGDGAADPDETARDLRRSFAASLAGKVFARYRQAQAVIVHVDEFEPVNMPEYRQGARPQWQEIYQAKFVQETPIQAEVPL